MTKLLPIERCDDCPYFQWRGFDDEFLGRDCRKNERKFDGNEGWDSIPDWCPLEDAATIKAQRDAAVAACAELVEAANCDDGEWDDLLAEATNLAQAVIDATHITSCDDSGFPGPVS